MLLGKPDGNPRRQLEINFVGLQLGEVGDAQLPAQRLQDVLLGGDAHLDQHFAQPSPLLGLQSESLVDRIDGHAAGAHLEKNLTDWFVTHGVMPAYSSGGETDGGGGAADNAGASSRTGPAARRFPPGPGPGTRKLPDGSSTGPACSSSFSSAIFFSCSASCWTSITARLISSNMPRLRR